MRATKLRLVGRIESHFEAEDVVGEPGDVALVHRTRPRSLVMRCPCGCKQLITINLDGRAGPAWRMYTRDGRMTLYPSISRETGCESHFIIWNDAIYWATWDSTLDEQGENPVLEARIRQSLADVGFIHYTDLAELLGDIPWAVLDSCRSLARRKIIQEGVGQQRGYFRFEGRSHISA